MSKKDQSTHVSILEAAQRIPDQAVDDVPEVRAALQALHNAEDRYLLFLAPSQAACARLEALKANIEAIRAMIGLAQDQRIRNAVAIVDGDMDARIDDRFVAEIERLERENERGGWALPVLEQRADELLVSVSRAADWLADCTRALADARMDAKIHIAERGGV